MVTHSNILAWKIPWTEKPGGHKEYNMTEHTHTHKVRCPDLAVWAINPFKSIHSLYTYSLPGQS